MEYDDPVIDILSHSPVALKLFNKASLDGVEFKRSQLKYARGYYKRGRKEIVQDVKSSFDATAHETVHHHHKDSNIPSFSNLTKNNILKRLIHEAEAYAIQALVIAEVKQASPSGKNVRKRIQEAIKSINKIYPDFEREADQITNNDSKAELANRVFKAYLTSENSQFKSHLKYYSKLEMKAPRSFIWAANSGILIGAAFILDFVNSYTFKIGLLDTGVKTYAAIFAFHAGAEILKAANLRKQSPFQKVFRETSIGNIPTIEENYLNNIRALPEDDTSFKTTLQKISNHVDYKLFNFETGVLKAVLSIVPQ